MTESGKEQPGMEPMSAEQLWKKIEQLANSGRLPSEPLIWWRKTAVREALSASPSATGERTEECSCCGKAIGPREEYLVYFGQNDVRLTCHSPRCPDFQETTKEVMPNDAAAHAGLHDVAGERASAQTRATGEQSAQENAQLAIEWQRKWTEVAQKLAEFRDEIGEGFDAIFPYVPQAEDESHKLLTLADKILILGQEQDELERELAEAREDKQHVESQKRQYEALISKIQDIVSKFFGKGERWSDFDVLNQGVWHIAELAEQRGAALHQPRRKRMASCQLCGEPMPKGEEMFSYHGYSGDCPKPPLTKMQRGSDKYIAWLRWVGNTDDPHRHLQICDSDAEGSFKVYRQDPDFEWAAGRDDVADFVEKVAAKYTDAARSILNGIVRDIRSMKRASAPAMEDEKNGDKRSATGTRF
jgi:hypothetical protein